MSRTATLMKAPEEGSLLRPVHTNTFALPIDNGLKLAYTVYNPAVESLLFEIEKGRSIFAEAFITNRNLGTLADLCVRALALKHGASSLKQNGDDPLRRRLQLDSISVDEPLEDIYEIEDSKFWRRVALAKTEDVALSLEGDSCDWKSKGVMLKYLELVEQCPAEFWPEGKMCALARKVKDHVTSLHIRKLQPLQDASFSQYCTRDSDTDKTTSTDVSDSTEDEMEDEEEMSNGEEEHEKNSERSVKKFDSRTSNASNLGSRRTIWSFMRGKVEEDKEEDLLEAKRFKAKILKQTEERRAERRRRREKQQKRRKSREEKRLKREEQNNRPQPKRIKVQGVFDLPIVEPEDDEKNHLDARNMESFLAFKRKNIYAPEHCHHIDLRFLSHFDKLVSFEIEFQPPELKAKYHKRYFDFSSEDIRNLASGISNLLSLRVFRLRDSRMNEEKLGILVFALKFLSLEVVDFGNDNLDDDCEIALRELFQYRTTIRSLELEGNRLGVGTLSSLGKALQRYGGKLEYLGLARNLMGSEGLHAFVSRIATTTQVESLSLAGIKISELAVLCCIADELLSQHKVLRHLDILGMPLSSRSGETLAKSMKSNLNLLSFDCRGCNLDESVELDIEICLRRNRYKAENSFVGDRTKTEAEIKEFVNRVKNPILLSAMEKVEKRRVCMEGRPDIAERYALASLPSTAALSASNSVDSESRQARYPSTVKASTSDPFGQDETTKVLQAQPPFVYDALNFDEEQFHRHVYLPLPERYYYFKAKNRSYCD